jgi:hypothetical protein
MAASIRQKGEDVQHVRPLGHCLLVVPDSSWSGSSRLPVAPRGYAPAMIARRTTLTILATTAALLLIGACGDGDDSTDTPVPEAGADAGTAEGQTTTTNDDAASGDGDECRFVPTEAVQEVFGDTVELRAAEQGCFFGDEDVYLQLTYIALQIDPEQYADEAVEANCDEGTAVEVDAGDRAFACISFVGPLGNFYEGRDLVVINTSGVEDEDAEAVRDQLAELLPALTAG